MKKFVLTLGLALASILCLSAPSWATGPDINQPSQVVYDLSQENSEGELPGRLVGGVKYTGVVPEVPADRPPLTSEQLAKPEEIQDIAIVLEDGQEASPEVVVELTEEATAIASADEYLAQFENIRVVSINWDGKASVVAILADKPNQETFEHLNSLGVVVRVIDIDTPFDEPRFNAAIDRYLQALAGSEISAAFNVDRQNRQIVIYCDETTTAFLTQKFSEDPDFELVRFELVNFGQAEVVFESNLDASLLRSTETPAALSLTYSANELKAPGQAPAVKTPNKTPTLPKTDSAAPVKSQLKPVVTAPSRVESKLPSSGGNPMPLAVALSAVILAMGRYVQIGFKKLS